MGTSDTYKSKLKKVLKLLDKIMDVCYNGYVR